MESKPQSPEYKPEDFHQSKWIHTGLDKHKF